MIINKYLHLTNENNMDLMARYQDNHFDLAIVDPPYGININMNMGRRKGEKKKFKNKSWDNSIPNENYFKELFRVSKNQIIWGGNYFTKFLEPTKSWVLWDKSVPQGVSFADGELAWTSTENNLRIARIPYSGFNGKDQNRIHPTQKPIRLYQWIFKNYAKTGDKILDTHLGSGSIAIALDCVNKIEKMDLSLVACEVDNDYYKRTLDRVRKETSWQSLF